MKKALLVTRVSGFVPQFEMNNVKILQQLGYEVHYAANFNVVAYGNDNDRLKGTGIICHHIPFCRSPFSPSVRKTYRQLKDLMQNESFDLIHCHMPMTGVIARMAAQAVRRNKKRAATVLYTTHGFHFYSGAPLVNWIYYLPERWLAHYTDCLITMNEEDFCRARSFSVRGQVEKISGVGIRVEQPMYGKDRQWMELGIRNEDFLMVSVGELNKNKNHIQILRALVQCKDMSIKYVLCGQGDMLEELKEFVKENGLEAQVVFAGYRSDVPHILASSDLFVFPSLREGLPVAVMEAMNMGLPIVAKRIRGNTDLIEQGKGGILVERGEPSEYAEAILKMKREPELAGEMGQWNQKRVQQFAASHVKEQMRDIYERITRQCK